MVRPSETRKRPRVRASEHDDFDARNPGRKRARTRDAPSSRNNRDLVDNDSDDEEDDDENESEHGNNSLDSKLATKASENIETLIENLQKKISKLKKKHPEAFESRKPIKLSFGADWEFLEEESKSSNPIHQEERDRLWESFYHKCVATSKQSAYAEVLSLHGLDEIELQKRVDMNSNEDEMTQNIGVEIPKDDYEDLMKSYLKLCERRVHDQFKKVWKAKLGEPESNQTGTQRANYQNIYFDWNNPHDHLL